MANIQIVNYGPQWEEAHMAFAIKYFHGRRKRINPDYIYWKFRGQHGKELDSFILAVADGLVVGQTGFVPAEMRLDNIIYKVQWICQIMVGNDFRGHGIAKMLYEEGLKRKITLGSDPSPSAAKSLARAGFNQVEGPWKLFFPLILSAISDKKFKKVSPILRRIKHPFLWGLSVSRIFNKRRMKDYQIDLESVDYDWIFSMQKQNRVYINRDYEFYTWRMSAFKDYQVAGEFYQKKDTYFCTIRTSGRLAFLGDFVYKDVKTARLVIQDILIDLNTRGFHELKITSHDTDIINVLKKIGFIKYSTKTDIIYCSANEQFNAKMENCDKFEYTYIDSDENI